MKSIPTANEFARAKLLMRLRNHNLDVVERNALSQLRHKYPIHNIFLFYSGARSFHVYVFFEKDIDLQSFKKSTTIEMIANVLYGEIERAGRGGRNDVSITFEYDSHERVLRDYDGDYYSRMR